MTEDVMKTEGRSDFSSPEAIAERRAAQHKRMCDGMEAALKDRDELALHEGPFTWGIAYHDGLFFQFYDKDGKPTLNDDVRDPEIAAWLLTRLNERSALLKCEEALRALLTATIEDCGDGDNCPDDHGGVALHADGSESAVTFPQIRAARAALTLLDEARK